MCELYNLRHDHNDENKGLIEESMHDNLYIYVWMNPCWFLLIMHYGLFMGIDA